MWETIERILSRIRAGRFLREERRKARRQKKHICDRTGFCPFTDSRRCKGCEEEPEVWE